MRHKHYQHHAASADGHDFHSSGRGPGGHSRGFGSFFGFRGMPEGTQHCGSFSGSRGFRGPEGPGEGSRDFGSTGDFVGPRAFGGVGGFAGASGPGGFGGPRGFGPMHGWGGGGRGGRRRREFDSGELRLLLLQLIAEQPRHGYDLIRELEARSGGGYAPSPGVVYPTLTMLQDMGLVAEAPAEGARKAYGITPEGTAHLQANKAQVEALTARIADMGSEQQRVASSSVQRAVKNLHQALVLRFAGNRGDARDPELSHRIAALLDEVTQKIERS